MTRLALSLLVGLTLSLPVASANALAAPSLDRLQGPLDRCWTEGGASDTSGAVGFALTLGVDGRVTQAAVIHSAWDDPDTTSCMLAVVQGASVPEVAGAASRLSYTWTFGDAAPVAHAPSAPTQREVLLLGRREAGRCYQQAFGDKPGHRGGVILNLLVVAAGEAHAEIASSTLGAPEFDACVARAFCELVFPATPGDQLLYIPLVFPLT